MKPTAVPSRLNDTVEPDVEPWRVELHQRVFRAIKKYGGAESSLFRPTITWLINALRSDPKQFLKKRGDLKTARAASLTFTNGIAWRVVFTLDEKARVVHVIAFAAHDEAYSDAKRRI
jgi:mRNA-degrading endonuclease RelE of RelBE toxin-antitoxin system